MYTGLSEYEARVYVAFLKKSPATAYEAARMAAVPTSKVYETVSRLEHKGILTQLEEGATKRYAPLPPEEYMHSSRQIMNRTLELLGQEFEQMQSEQPVSFVWNLNDYEALMDRVKRIMLKAEDTLLVSLWKQEAGVLGGILSEAAARGVRIASVHYGQPELEIGQVFMHPVGRTLFDQKGGRSIVVVADSKEALMGTIRDGAGSGDGTGDVPSPESVEGAHSTGRGFVDLAEDYVKHDIYMMKIISRFDPFLKERFGTRYEMLMDVFSDKETL